MLKRVSPLQFDRATTQGRTQPSFVTCECDDGTTVELVAKFSGGCDEGNINLAREMIGACLAGDLSLPIPEPFLIEISREWAETIPDDARRTKIQQSSTVAFGSRVMTGQFSVWNPGNLIPDIMLPTAASIFVFDAVIQNPDRRSNNPNCLIRGNELRIFDHELAFSHDLVFGWVPPWRPGGLKSLEINGNHIFRAGLKGRTIDYAPIRTAWMGLSDAKIAGYEAALPAEWTDVAAAAASATQLIRGARDNIDAVLAEVKRVLT